jgi:predicted TIM-barrel fold metal-dependent hydrolase
MDTEYNMDWLISVDDHALEPGNVWTSRLPQKFQDLCPQLKAEDGTEFWVYENKHIPVPGLAASSGRDIEDYSWAAPSYSSMRAGYYDSAARLPDMDEAGILASLCFPSMPRFCGQEFLEAKDKELALLCVRAYNDWMIEEWCAVAPGRFIPLIIIPLWDPKEAGLEIRRRSEQGVHAICFSEKPSALGLPSIWDADGYWDPVFQACDETQTVVCMHIGSSSENLQVSAQTPGTVNFMWNGGVRPSATMLDWIFSPIFARFENLKIALSEGGIGWMPYFLERAQQVCDKQGHLAARGEVIGNDGQLRYDPSEIVDLSFDLRDRFANHVFGCFIDDFAGIANIRAIGIDNVMLETDYPHSDSTWPNCIKHANVQLDSNPTLTREEKYKILRGNAERLYSFTPANPPS